MSLKGDPYLYFPRLDLASGLAMTFPSAEHGTSDAPPDQQPRIGKLPKKELEVLRLAFKLMPRR